MYHKVNLYSSLQATENKERDVLFFFLGAVAYLFGIIVAYKVSPSLSQLIQASALVPVFFYGNKIISVQTDEPYFKLLFTVFMISNVFIILRIEGFSYVKFKDYLFSDFRLWPYIVPFTAFFTRKSFFFYWLFRIIFWLGITYLFISVVLWRDYKASPAIAEQAIWIFSSASGLVLLTWTYHNAIRKLVAVVGIVLSLYVSALLARRNIILTGGCFIAFSYLAYLAFEQGHATKKFLSLYIFGIMIIAGAAFFSANKNSSFKLLAGRVKDDTREYVFDQYFISMENNMWFGKGIDGTYYCPLVTEDINVDPVEYRDLIECGYLQVMLKGGITNLVLLLAILVSAAIIGIFFSKNMFTKGCGIMICLWLIDMGPYGLPTFSMRYILVWICVGVCFDKKIRLAGEETIRNLIWLAPNHSHTLNK
ncbi:MAG: hypothetical protein ABIU63_06165 [Chitinophagaceae bacterium]